jgi:hypothetical protein
VTKVALHQIQPPDLSKIVQENVKELQKSINSKESALKVIKQKEVELPWRITPSTDTSKLVKHYMMLSKIRLTCKTII